MRTNNLLTGSRQWKHECEVEEEMEKKREHFLGSILKEELERKLGKTGILPDPFWAQSDSQTRTADELQAEKRGEVRMFGAG